ncbi:MAG TPA: RNA-binding cell elongation regulator Jag/EloR [Gaiellaceae bacterium]|nr:RNA-binding cell elongation regulator Jag/EloR [Gaiellaceae bacterium]
MAEGISVEATGETVGEAKWVALRELERIAPGLDKAAVRFQVVSEGERGLLGVGFEPARVVATVDPDAVAEAAGPVDEIERAAKARALVDRVTASLGLRCRIDVVEGEETITVSCAGGDLGLLIGRHGQTIDAVQYLANAIVNKGVDEGRKRVVVDAAGYRERREETLHREAVRAAERAASTGEPVELEPMTSIERRVVHERLKDYPGVETSSEGAEPNRYVVVSPSS